MNKCPDCDFFDPLPSEQHGQGLCRYRPPVVIPVQSATPSKGALSKPFTTWPIVRNSDWCGHGSFPPATVVISKAKQ